MTSQKPAVSFLLLGAGSGERIGGHSKAFILYEGLTLLEHAVRAVSGFGGEILVGLRPDDVSRGRSILGASTNCLPGGRTRQETIRLLAAQASGDTVVVHDIARPFAEPALFEDVIEGTGKHAACVAVIPSEVRDSLCHDEDGFAGPMIDRRTIVQIQTPQAFSRRALMEVLENAAEEGREESSLVGLFRAAGQAVQLVEGAAENIKITYPGDLHSPAITRETG